MFRIAPHASAVRAIALLALWTLLLSPLARGARADASTTVLPIAFHVASVDGEPVVPPEFVPRHLERANEIFEPYGVVFTSSANLPLAGEHAALETRADRDALGAEVQQGVIDCFVVRSLRDVDDPSQMRRGVHWHSQTHPGAHFVILSSIAGLNVLAHELGHFLGHPGHSDVAGNLMSYIPGVGLPVLDARQQRRMKRSVTAYLRRGELRAVRAALSVSGPPARQPSRQGERP